MRNSVKSLIILILLIWVFAPLFGCSPHQTPAAAPVNKDAVEAQWSAATVTLREQGGVPAFEDADMLCFVESVDETGLEAFPIYRSMDEAGTMQPQIMFSDNADPISEVIVSSDTPVDILYVQQDAPADEIQSGSSVDIVPGSIVSVWGDYEEPGNRFIAEHIVVWRTEEA